MMKRISTLFRRHKERVIWTFAGLLCVFYAALAIGMVGALDASGQWDVTAVVAFTAGIFAGAAGLGLGYLSQRYIRGDQDT